MELRVIKTQVTWVLVADAKTAQIYMPKRIEHRVPMVGNSKRHPATEERGWELIPILARPLLAESAKQYETGRNKTGMVFESFSSARHMAEPHLDARREVMRHFARRIVDFMGSAKNGEAFDRLVLVAPPEMMEEIDAVLPHHVRHKVMARIVKELTQESPKTLTEHLKDYY